MTPTGFPTGLPERTLGWSIMKWCTEYLLQPDGDGAGDPWVFTDVQALFLLWYYAMDEKGRFVYRRGCFRTAKGTGKSPFVAAICIAELVGPVRFNGFDSLDRDGDLLGKPVHMARVQIAATAEDQTKNTFDMVSAMCAKDSKVYREYQLEVGKTYVDCPATSSKLNIITSSPKTAEGNRPTFAVMDETEWWAPENGGKALFRVLRRNLRKTKASRSLETCNAFIPGTESVAEDTHNAVMDHLAGARGGGDILYYAKEAPADTDLNDPESVLKALREVYSDSPWQNVEDLLAEILDPSTPASDSRRFYLNQIVAAEDSWCQPHEWDAIENVTKAIDPTEPVAWFFDGSKSGDHTALIGVRIEDGHIFVPKDQYGKDCIWVPPTKGEIDAVQVDRAVRYVVNGHNSWAMFGDVREWESFVKVSWPEEFGDALKVKATPSGKLPEMIAWDMRQKIFEFTVACETAYSELKEKSFTQDGNQMLRQHVLAMKINDTPKGQSVRKESKNSPHKIDAGVCMIGVRMVRRIVLASKEWDRYTRRGTGRARVLT